MNEDEQRDEMVRDIASFMQLMKVKYGEDMHYLEYLLFMLLGGTIQKTHGSHNLNLYLREGKKKWV